jgi:hypothetical protein
VYSIQGEINNLNDEKYQGKFWKEKFHIKDRPENQCIQEMKTTKVMKENIKFNQRIKLKSRLWKEKIHLEHEVHDQTLSTDEGEIINLEFSYSQFLNKFEEHSSFDRQLYKSLIVFLYR